MTAFSFTITDRDDRSRARRGVVHTAHGTFDTPAFMPVGTRGAVKGLTPAQLEETGTQIILANTYHLQMRPGPQLIAQLGGLHRFMGWDGPILTDSGGFQVFSLAELSEVDDEGVTFRSPIDGAVLRLDAESAVRIQHQLGADLITAFDECPPLPADLPVIEQAVQRTVRWARRCRDAHAGHDQQALFGVVQGGLDLDLRQLCLDELVGLDLAGYAVGGLSVGEPAAERQSLLDELVPAMPELKPRYLMGVGTPADLLAAVRCGVDLFDCVLPTRNGRNGYAFTAGGPIRLRNEVHRSSEQPIEPGCGCYACRRFGRGYLRHLFLSGEMLGPVLVSLHNVTFYQRFMLCVRQAIAAGNLEALTKQYPVARWATHRDEEMK